MSRNLALEALPRDDRGKNAIGRLRRAGNLPAVLYTEGEKESEAIMINQKEFLNVFKHVNIKGTLVSLTLNGKKMTTLVCDYQFDPVRDVVLHADFYQILPDSEGSAVVKRTVPLVFSGVPVGVREGGVINQQVKTIDIECMKRFVPTSVKVDMTPLKIGDTVAVSGVKTMENITYTSKPDLVLVSLDSAPVVVASEDDE